MSEVRATFEVELPLDSDQDDPDPAPQPEQPNGATQALVSAGRAVGRVLGAVWRAVKPEDDAAPAESEEE